MDFMNKILIATLLLIQVFQDCDCACSDNLDCKTCANDDSGWFSCNWCTLSKSCHTKWSFLNKCSVDQNVNSESKCLVEDKYEYNATEAYKLALFSAMSYSDKPDKCLQAIFPGNTYIMKSVLLQNCEFLLDYDKHCTAFVAYSHVNKEVIFAFRGTIDTTQLFDQILSTLLTPTENSPIGGYVQNYFNNVYTKFYDTVKNFTTKLRKSYPNYKVKLTGHSLGGTTASITSAMLIKENIVPADDVSLYTFGMPRVGNKDYALAHDKLVPNSWRVVREGDMIAKLPTCPLLTLCSLLDEPYHHGNKVIYSGDIMAKNSTYAVCDGNEDAHEDCKKITPSLTRKKRFIAKALKKHTAIFGLRLGTYCQEVLNQAQTTPQSTK